MPTPTRVEANIGTDDNVPETSIYWFILYASIIEMMFYMESNTRPDIYFYIHNCAWFTYNTHSLYETLVNIMYQYLRGKDNKGLVFNPYKIIMVGFNVHSYFTVLSLHENHQHPVCDNISTGCVVTFSNFPLLWVSKIQTYLFLSALKYEYMVLLHSFRYILTLKSFIK